MVYINDCPATQMGEEAGGSAESAQDFLREDFSTSRWIRRVTQFESERSSFSASFLAAFFNSGSIRRLRIFVLAMVMNYLTLQDIMPYSYVIRCIHIVFLLKKYFGQLLWSGEMDVRSAVSELSNPPSVSVGRLLIEAVVLVVAAAVLLQFL